MNKRSVLRLGGDNQAPFFVIIAATLWAVNGIAFRPILFNLPVSLVVLIESLIVALLLTPFMLRTLNVLKQLSYKDWLSFLVWLFWRRNWNYDKFWFTDRHPGKTINCVKSKRA